MKISYNWLKEYITIDLDVESVSKILTDIGLEVEGYELFQTVKGGLKGIVVGKVLTCDKHPNADKLHVTTVDIGNNTILPIVCGAPNVAAGQTVFLATEGTKLYDGDKEFEIKAAKIRGEVSQGMLCSEVELGIGTNHDGIMVLPDSISAGTLAKDYCNVQDDYVFEIGLTPNRIDAASHFGVARDIAAFLNLSSPCSAIKPSIEAFTIDSKEQKVEVSVSNNELCPRYAGLVISGVTIKESPAWLKNKLQAIGQKSINNVVDITNFILHDMAQPLHAFDLAKIEGNKVIVSTVAEKTKFTTLDGVERELSSEDLMICNANKPMCIAGVFGGIDSGVSSQTTDIFLESAYFNPVSVRKTARRHGLSTDASFRFERGIDPNNTVFALKRAAILIKEVAGGTIHSPIFDTHPTEFEPTKVELQFSKIQSLIGKNIEIPIIKKILESLEIKTISENGDSLVVSVPAYRVDVQRQEDIVEDILRIYGYNNIEIPSAIRSSIVYSSGVNSSQLKNIISDLLVSSGWFEIMNNSLTRSSYYSEFDLFPANSIVSILNPLSTDLDSLRATLLFGCLEVAQYNSNRQMQDVSIFEFGTVYSKIGTQGDVLQKYSESQNLAFCMQGKQLPQYWNQAQEDVDLFVMKSIIIKVCSKLGINSVSFSQFSNSCVSGLNIIVQDTEIGYFGVVSKKISKKFDLDKSCFYAELNWTKLLQLITKEIRYKEIPQFPEVRRDLSLLIDSKITFENIKKIANETERKLIKQINVFDVYQGKGIPEGKKSYAISFILQDTQKTLTDSQIDAVMNKLISKFTSELGAELR